jgi:Mg2+ and Co2+ transporter CorA
MLQDRLVVALSQLEIGDVESVKHFKREIRHTMEIFLRFTHRYWFHEITNQMQMKDLYQMCVRHLDTPRLFTEVRQSVYDMHQYLDSDGLRRQANTVVRLTVVTTFGMIGTITTGILGMNVFDEASEPGGYRLALFAFMFALATALTLYTINKSKALSDFLETMADERQSLGRKLVALVKAWWLRGNLFRS